jgi:hypothetical protein
MIPGYKSEKKKLFRDESKFNLSDEQPIAKKERPFFGGGASPLPPKFSAERPPKGAPPTVFVYPMFRFFKTFPRFLSLRTVAKLSPSIQPG